MAATTGPALFLRNYQTHPQAWQETINAVLKSREQMAHSINGLRYQEVATRTIKAEHQVIYDSLHIDTKSLQKTKALTPKDMKLIWSSWRGRTVANLVERFDESERKAVGLFFGQFLQPQPLQSLTDFVYSGESKILEATVREQVTRLFLKRLKKEAKLLDPKQIERVNEHQQRIRALDATIQHLRGPSASVLPSLATIEKKIELQANEQELRSMYLMRLKTEGCEPPFALPISSRVYFHKSSLLGEIDTMLALPKFIEISEELQKIKTLIDTSENRVALEDLKNHSVDLTLTTTIKVKYLSLTSTLKAVDSDPFQGLCLFAHFYDAVDKILLMDHKRQNFPHIKQCDDLNRNILECMDRSIQSRRGRDSKPWPSFAELVKELDLTVSP